MNRRSSILQRLPSALQTSILSSIDEDRDDEDDIVKNSPEDPNASLETSADAQAEKLWLNVSAVENMWEKEKRRSTLGKRRSLHQEMEPEVAETFVTEAAHAEETTLSTNEVYNMKSTAQSMEELVQERVRLRLAGEERTPADGEKFVFLISILSLLFFLVHLIACCNVDKFSSIHVLYYFSFLKLVLVAILV